MLVVCQLGRKLAECVICCLEFCVGPIVSYAVNESVCLSRVVEQIVDLSTEVVCMRLRSVVALEFPRNDGGNQLSLHS